MGEKGGYFIWCSDAIITIESYWQPYWTGHI